jgi:glycosyltransferase involved in cell wall biosynthesis
MTPRATILIRMYNSEKTIRRALDSAVNQTISRNKYKILVVDNGSSDKSVEIASSYAGIKLIAANIPGSIPALNHGLREVDTEFVILLDSDDWFEPVTLDSILNVLDTDSGIDYVYSDYYEVVGMEKMHVSVKENIFHTLAAGIMFSMSFLRENDYYDESLILPEYDLLIKTLSTAKRRYVPVPLYNYFRHEGSMTSDSALIERGKRQLYKKYGKEYPIRDY